MNQFGRSYRPGVALAQDLKFLIIDSIIRDGGDRITGYIPRSVTQFARELRVSVNTVKSVWFRYCEEMITTPKPKGGLTFEKLKEDDRELIEVLKLHSPSMSLSEIMEELEQLGGQEISMSAVSRAIKSRLPSGDQERLPFVNKNRKFRLETQMVQLIPPESFWKRWKSSEVFLFSRSNRNDRKNPVPFENSHSTRCTSASFPAIRRCRCSRHLFSSSRESLGLGETPTPGKSCTITSIPFQPDFPCKW